MIYTVLRADLSQKITDDEQHHHQHHCCRWLTPRLDGRLVSHFSFDTHRTQEVKAEHPLLLNRPFCRRWTCLSPPLPIVVTLGLAREALFYQNWEQLLTARECASCELGDVLLHMYNASGNMEMGEKMIPDGRLAVKGIWWLSSAWIHNPNEMTCES